MTPELAQPDNASVMASMTIAQTQHDLFPVVISGLQFSFVSKSDAKSRPERSMGGGFTILARMDPEENLFASPDLAGGLGLSVAGIG